MPFNLLPLPPTHPKDQDKIPAWCFLLGIAFNNSKGLFGVWLMLELYGLVSQLPKVIGEQQYQ